MVPERSPEEVTLMIRAGALASSASSSRFVNKNGARWLTAKVVSIPSTVNVRLLVKIPALLISTCSRLTYARTTTGNEADSFAHAALWSFRRFLPKFFLLAAVLSF